MSSRLKSLGFGSKRKSNANLPTTGTSAQTPNGSTPVAGTPPASSSQTSLTPMNSQQGLGRPPSYSYNNVAGRPQSPMPPPGQQQQPTTTTAATAHHPPPIDTSRGYIGANPPMAQQPPGYGGAGYGQMNQQPLQQMGQYGQHMRPAEVEGANRSKAQLIVGIDFVGENSYTARLVDVLTKR